MEMNTMPSFSKNTICRVCMQIDTNLFPIFNEIFTGDNNTITVAKILSEFTKYPVTYNDQLPAQVCYKCMTLARTVHQFIRQTEEAYCYLKALYDKTWVPERQISGNLVTETMCTNTTNMHTQTEESNVFQCKICLKNFFAVSELRQHRFAIHGNNGKKCHVCEKTFNKLRQLKTHISTEHPSEGIPCDFKCNICSKEFRRKKNLERHFVIMHSSKDNTLNITSVSLDEPEIETVIPPRFNANSSHCQDYQEDGNNETHTNETLGATNPLSNEDEGPDHHSFNTMELDIKDDDDYETTANETMAAANPLSDEDEGQDHHSFNTMELDIKDDDDYETTANATMAATNPLSNENEGLDHQSFNTMEKVRNVKQLRQGRSAIHDNDQLKTHISTEHTSENIHCDFKCNICSKVFKRKTNLERHLVVMHSSNDNTLNSSHCQDYQEDIDIEMPTNETMEATNPLSNEDEGLEHHSSNTMEIDIKNETPANETMAATNPLSNEDQGHDHRSSNTMEQVQNVKQLRQYRSVIHDNDGKKCRVCRKTFKKLRQLKAHLFTKHPSENIHCNFKCNICSKEFKRKTNLERHLVVIHSSKDNTINSNNVSLDEPEIETLIPCGVNENTSHCQVFQDNDDYEIPANETISATNPLSIKNGGLDHHSFNDDYEIPANETISATNPLSIENGGLDHHSFNTKEKVHSVKQFEENITLPEISIKAEPIEIVDSSDDMNESIIKTNTMIPEKDKDVNNDKMNEPKIKKNAIIPEVDVNDDGMNEPNIITNTIIPEKDNDVNHDDDDMNEPIIKTKTVILEDDVDNYDKSKGKGEDENMCILNNKNYNRKSYKNKYPRNPDTNMYQCVECSLEFTLLENLKHHMSRHTYKRPFVCHICFISFTSKYKLRKHLRDIHVRDYERKSCKNKYQRKPNTNMYQCVQCLREFKTLSSVKRHTVSHSDDTPFLCHICSVLFKYKDNLKRHLLRFHAKKQFDGGDKNEPNIKTKTIIPKKDKKKYQRNRYTNMYQCVECLIEFKLLSNLKRHMSSHTNDKPFMCHICSISFKYNNHLRKHILRIHAKKKFACNKGVDDNDKKESEDKNKYILNNKNYNSKRLNKKYQKNPNTHMYECVECQMEFKLQRSLKCHLVSHTDDKPFKCPICSIPFIYKNNLQKHIQVFHAKDNDMNETIIPEKDKDADDNYNGEGEVENVCKLNSKDFDGYMDETNIKTKTIIPQEDKNVDVNDNDNNKNNGEDENMCKLNSKDNDRKSFKKKYQRNPNTNMYQCVECLMEFKLLGNLKCHMSTHTANKPFICLLCSISFKYKTNLRKHLLRIHAKKKFACNKDVDDKPNFKTKTIIPEKDKEVDDNDKGENENENKPKLNIKRKSYKKNYQINPDTNMYQCVKCPMDLKSLDELKSHISTHPDDTKFVCRICSMTFTRKSNLFRHLKRFHAKKE